MNKIDLFFNKTNETLDQIKELHELSDIQGRKGDLIKNDILSELDDCIAIIQQTYLNHDLLGLKKLQNYVKLIAEKENEEDIIRIFETLFAEQEEIIENKINTIISQLASSILSLENQEAYYLDENRLLKGKPDDKSIRSIFRQWFLNQAFFGEYIHKDKKDGQGANITIKQLEFLALHGYSKVATVGQQEAEDLGMQTTPLLPQDHLYYRSTPSNVLLSEVTKAFAEEIGTNTRRIHLIDSPLAAEVLAREIPPKFDAVIKDEEQFNQLVDQLFNLIKQGNSLEEDEELLIDISPYFANKYSDPTQMEEASKVFEEIFLKKLDELVAQHPSIDGKRVMRELASKLHLIIFTTYKTQPLLLVPSFLEQARLNNSLGARYFENLKMLMFNKPIDFNESVNKILSRTGFRPAPDQIKKAWLNIKSAAEIFEALSLPQAQIAMKEREFPIVYKSWNQFLNDGIVTKFRELSEKQEAPPYLQILPQATFQLLEGLAECQVNGHGIDQIFKDKGIEGLLQLSYFRMQNAMNEAIFHKDHLIEFMNQMEIIHQEIQMILEIAQPHDQDVLAHSIQKKLTEGLSPIVPSDLEVPNVHLKSSAMHGFSSILSSVEAQKGDKNLHVAILKDSYYESVETLTGARKTYHSHILRGDQFVESLNKTDEINAKAGKPIPKFDLFVCEFHHNMSLTSQHYRPENILAQVKTLYEQGRVADQFTVMIDTTIDLEKSPDVQAFLADETIKSLIKEGKLNIVLLRSAQKFDMLGMDNYYGGITATINSHHSFEQFNKRMNAKEDQLRGLSYQGLAHLQKYGGSSLDAYRSALMRNAQTLYAKLPEAAIYKKGIKNPMQFGRIEDKRLLYIDISFPHYPELVDACEQRLLKFVADEKLPFTKRSSFGFETTNFTIIDGKLRLHPGLEDEKTIDRYAAFFNAIQQRIEETLQAHPVKNKRDRQEVADLLAQQIAELEIS